MIVALSTQYDAMLMTSGVNEHMMLIKVHLLSWGEELGNSCAIKGHVPFSFSYFPFYCCLSNVLLKSLCFIPFPFINCSEITDLGRIKFNFSTD